MATPGNFGGGNTVPGQVFLGITDNGGTAKRAGAARGGAPRALCGKSRAPRPQSTRRRERLAVEVSFQESTAGDIPISPSNFQREGAARPPSGKRGLM
jgi:hypothetical protein